MRGGHESSSATLALSPAALLKRVDLGIAALSNLYAQMAVAECGAGTHVTNVHYGCDERHNHWTRVAPRILIRGASDIRTFGHLSLLHHRALLPWQYENAVRQQALDLHCTGSVLH